MRKVDARVERRVWKTVDRKANWTAALKAHSLVEQ
jgi:hypothetical protein